MGGNALKEFNTVRLPTSDVEFFGTDIVDRLTKYGRASMIPSYRNKETHGDLDILIDSEVPTHHIENIIFNVSPCATQRIHSMSNGSARSFGIQLTPDTIFQVDIIHAKPEIYDYALSYFSYNDCGNLIGVTAHKTGLRFGHQGLQYVVRDNTYVLGTIVVDLDFQSSLEFLGFDYNAWKLGFDDLDDIFKWVSTSKYFNSSYYPLEHRSHIARIRDKKRPTYNAFLKWIQENEVIDNPVINKDVWLTTIMDHYPAVKTEYDLIHSLNEKRKAVLEKFNGNIVRDISGLSGKSLGNFMSVIKSRFETPDEFSNHILACSESDIRQLIYGEYLLWGNNE